MANTGKEKLEIGNWQEADTAMFLYRERCAKVQKLNVALDEALTKVQASHLADLETAEGLVDKSLAALKKFAQARKAEFKPSPNGDGRSYEHAGVTLGFRQSPGRVEIRKEEEVIEWLRDFREGVFVRIVHQADREALLEILRSAQDDRLVGTLAAHGIKFEQKDRFFLEVKSDK